ncbi:MAG: hypothetical protein ACYC9O_10255 [Candidatus Latescibacterota bacterium]
MLRRFEPVLRFTKGEYFFPMDVEAYVRESSLWVHRPGEEAELLVSKGKLSLERLAEPRSGGFDTVFFLKFVEPLSLDQLTHIRLRNVGGIRDFRKHREEFRAESGRLARVGYFSRMIDTLFSLTLLTRGRITGDTAASASLEYDRIMADNERYVYYGRVVRDMGWTILQYWFFYPFNNWRSGFFGLNDHEGDWEMVCVYLWEDSDGSFRPEWAAYAAHDFSGDDLRRRWDDPELEKAGEHPVVYVGAGSHASYFLAGEYITELELPFLVPVSRSVNRMREFIGRMARFERRRRWRTPSGNTSFRVPFVDYARGNGISIGPGQDREWSDALPLYPVPGWALHYRGLWGLYTRDIISGEDAPAGPLYNRDGTIRSSWYDPLGWVGLDREPLPSEMLACLEVRRARLKERNSALIETAGIRNADLHARGAEIHVLQGEAHLREEYASKQAEIRTFSAELDGIRARLASNEAIIDALDRYIEKLRAGYRPSPHAHLRRPPRPTSERELCLSRLAETWAAVSIGLVMLGVLALFLFVREYVGIGLTALVIMIMAVEAVFRRRVRKMIDTVTIILAMISSVILLYEFFWSILVVLILFAGGYILVQNLRELNTER